MVNLAPGLNFSSRSFFLSSGFCSLSSCLFFLCLHPDAPFPSPGRLSPDPAPVTLPHPPHSLLGGTRDQRPSQLFHFRVLGACDPFLEFLYQGRPRPSLGPCKVTALGLAPHAPWLQTQGLQTRADTSLSQHVLLSQRGETPRAKGKFGTKVKPQHRDCQLPPGTSRVPDPRDLDRKGPGPGIRLVTAVPL